MSIGLIIPCAVVGLALLNDPAQAVKLTTAIITVRGITWISTKITSFNKDNSELINITGWCLAGVPAIALLKVALSGITEFAADMQKVGDFFNSIGQWIDKITFWS